MLTNVEPSQIWGAVLIGAGVAALLLFRRSRHHACPDPVHQPGTEELRALRTQHIDATRQSIAAAADEAFYKGKITTAVELHRKTHCVLMFSIEPGDPPEFAADGQYNIGSMPLTELWADQNVRALLEPSPTCDTDILPVRLRADSREAQFLLSLYKCSGSPTVIFVSGEMPAVAMRDFDARKFAGAVSEVFAIRARHRAASGGSTERLHALADHLVQNLLVASGVLSARDFVEVPEEVWAPAGEDTLSIDDSWTKSPISETAAIRSQQEEEYALALAADRAKDEAARAERAAAQRAEEEAAAAEDEMELRAALRLSRQSCLPQEPEPGEKDTVLITVRLAVTGRKITRRWRTDDPISRVFDWVECTAHLGEGVDGEDFSLASTFPRTRHTRSEVTLARCGLDTDSVLFVEEPEH